MAEEYDPEHRLAQMKKAIAEKAEFIKKNHEVSARQAYEAEFSKVLETENVKTYQKLQSERTKYISDKKIEKSRLINEMRLSKMSKRYGLLENLRGEIRKKLEQKLQNKDEYKRILKDLILQAMIKLMEPEVALQCLRNDVTIIEGLVKDCQNEFNSLVQRECKKTIDSKIKINKDHFLEEKIFENENINRILGGIVLSCHNGNIVVSNTIDSRIEFAFQEMLPEIREGLYPDPVRNAHDAKRRQEQLAAQQAAANKSLH